MAPQSDEHIGRTDGAGHQHPGERIRTARRQQKLSLRELARRAELTPSHVSKIERGVTNPSVGALWKISDVLGITVAQLFPAPAASAGLGAVVDGYLAGRIAGFPDDAAGGSATGVSPVVDPRQREIIRMTGVEFQRLTPSGDDFVEFIEVRHEVGAGDDEAYHHRGREYGLVLSGRLQVDVGFNKYLLEPGFSVAFDSSIPHRVLNVGNEPAVAIWLTIGRGHPHGG